jgi:hypothetical protein
MIRRSFLIAAGLLLMLTVAAPVASGQHIVASPQALGMGDAAVAAPAPQSALFYNPAHLTHFSVSRTPITLIGANASLTRNVDEQLSFYQDDLEPAIDRGIDNLSEAEESTLYDGLFRVGREMSEMTGALVLPSFVMNRGTYGLGGGIYARSYARNQIEDAGAGIPGVDFSAVGDLIATGAASLNLSTLGLHDASVGLAGRYTMRYLTLKTKPVDALDPDENIHMLRGQAFGVDLGLLYDVGRVAGAGHLLLGATGYNLLASDFSYDFEGYVTKNSERDDATITEEVALADVHFQQNVQYRVGAAYVLPQTWRFLRETTLALDYLGAPQAPADRSILTRLHLGAQTSINDWLYLRAGLNQGYSTAGLGLHLSFVQIDYAFYGQEKGRFAGQRPSWHHRVQILLGSF